MQGYDTDKMRMHNSDKAIEFNAVYGGIERTIDALSKAEIDVSDDRKKAANIKREIESKASKKTKTFEIEGIYTEGIERLKEISRSLKRHEVYYMSYYSAESIDEKLAESEISSKQIHDLALATISLLKQINNSDTRAFKKEENVVDKIYDVAYSMIKMELLSSGKSEVLAWVKEDEVASSLIDTRVFGDISNVPKESGLYSEIRAMLKDINGIGAIPTNKDNLSLSDLVNDSINYTSLDEGLILFLAMHDSRNLKKIEALLFDSWRKVQDSESKKYTQESQNMITEDKIRELTEKIKKSRIYKRLALTIAMLGLAVAVKQGSEAIAPTIGHNEYRTYPEYYSSIGAEAPEYPEYMEGIDNYSQTTLTAYGVWNREGVFYGDYQRKIVVFDLSNVDLENLEDYENIDFSELACESKDTEHAEEINPEELYEEAIVEITRIIQDQNDVTFVPHEESQETFLTIAATISAVISLFTGWFITGSIINKTKERFTSGKLKKEELANLAEGLKKYKMLCEQNEEFKQRFMEAYQKYSKIIDNEKLKDAYDTCSRQRKNNN